MIYDLNTKNESFLDVHNFLKDRGIKNNKFMLQLNNHNLVAIDPFEPNLSKIEKLWIMQECIANPWYFIREIARWEHNGKMVPTKLDRGNVVMYWCALNGISTWRTNIRQTCSDLSVETLLLWILISTRNTESKVISAAPDSFHYELSKILNGYTMLPESLVSILPPLSTVGGGRRGLEHIKNKHIQSEINGIPRLRTQESAQCYLRGNLADVIFFHMSEFIPRLSTVIDNRNPVISYNLHGTKRINIFNSSYGHPDDETTSFSQEYINGMIKWKDTFYDKDPDDLIRALSEYGNGIIYIKNNYKELGYDDIWANNLRKILGEDAFKREILLQRM